jgi:hypothetical protein
MRLHGAPVEREKSGAERGKYQHPEYYGLPPEMGMDGSSQRERRPQYGSLPQAVNDAEPDRLARHEPE